jgi:hypothetical protein
VEQRPEATEVRGVTDVGAGVPQRPLQRTVKLDSERRYARTVRCRPRAALRRRADRSSPRRQRAHERRGCPGRAAFPACRRSRAARRPARRSALGMARDTCRTVAIVNRPGSPPCRPWIYRA